MDKYHSDNEYLRAVRADAASLLGLEDPPSQDQNSAAAGDVGIFTLVIEAAPDAPWGYHYRGSAHAALGQWDQAADDFSKAFALGRNHVWLWYESALVSLARSDKHEYQKTCMEMLDHFAEAPDTNLGYWIAWTCTLAPDAVPDFSRPMAFAENAVASDPKNCDYLNTHGGLLYRAGRFDEAAERLSEAEAAYQTTPNPRSSVVYCWLFLAMTRQRLGQTDEAREWLARAVQRMDQSMPELLKNPDFHGVWNRILTLQLLRREAEQLLGAKGDEG
jgi:tetratricopeptide (TPR) repeat protein